VLKAGQILEDSIPGKNATPCTALQGHKIGDKTDWVGNKKHALSYDWSPLAECLWQEQVSERLMQATDPLFLCLLQ
jgi:hypothetical protein